MTLGRDRIALIVGALVAFILQIVLSPIITIVYAMPNFVSAYVLVVAVMRPSRPPIALAFVCGMLYNLVIGGPVGAMALLLVIAAWLVSLAFRTLTNDSLFMAVVALIVVSVAVEFFYGALIVTTGATDAGLLDALVYRALPCALYDCVVGLILLPIVMKFVVRSDGARSAFDATSFR